MNSNIQKIEPEIRDWVSQQEEPRKPSLDEKIKKAKVRQLEEVDKKEYWKVKDSMRYGR